MENTNITDIVNDFFLDAKQIRNNIIQLKTSIANSKTIADYIDIGRSDNSPHNLTEEFKEKTKIFLSMDFNKIAVLGMPKQNLTQTKKIVSEKIQPLLDASDYAWQFMFPQGKTEEEIENLWMNNQDLFANKLFPIVNANYDASFIKLKNIHKPERYANIIDTLSRKFF